MFDMCIEFATNPYMIMDSVACAHYYNESIADELTHRLINDLEVTYDFLVH